MIRAGGLVVFPTETVYGLGANALDAAAVRHIFVAKGRPPNNPIIVHVADAAAARNCALDWPANAARLAHACWPGPLTLVLPKQPCVPDIVTAGGATVAIRVPDNAIALALLRAADRPIAAPSANRSGEISPTLATHALESIGDQVDLILDGGPCRGGLESTVLDLTCDPPRILRLGLLMPSRLRTLLGAVEDQVTPSEVGPGMDEIALHDAPMRSPGQLARHYAPRAQLECSSDPAARLRELTAAGKRCGWITTTVETVEHARDSRPITVIHLRPDPEAFAARLYAALHDLDAVGVEYIIVDEPPANEAWAAVRDRLHRASRPPP